MDAMLGCGTPPLGGLRPHDVANFIPARLTGLILLVYFAVKGRFAPPEALRGSEETPGSTAGY